MSQRRDAIIRKILNRVKFVPCPALGTDCWQWTGPTSGSKGRGHGYGRMSLDGQTVAVHIVMWVCHHGFLPGKRQLDHLCENRKCCNPEHLDNVTHLRNQKRRAAAAKLRRVPGRTDAFYNTREMSAEDAELYAAINGAQWTEEELAGFSAGVAKGLKPVVIPE